jgi:hypothetical protein
MKLTRLTLMRPRTGPVNPEICPVCAALRDAAYDAADARSPSAVRTVIAGMVRHKNFGHWRTR